MSWWTCSSRLPKPRPKRRAPFVTAARHPSGLRTVREAYESWVPLSDEATGPQRRGPQVLLTCDHASARLPGPLRWPHEDLAWVGTHWSYDLGAAAIAHELSALLQAPLVCSRFSRLLVDPNRTPQQDSFIVSQIQGAPLALNQGLSPAARQWRQNQFYESYHRAIDALLHEQRRAHTSPLLVSIHTFTPVYQGQTRTMQGGVLFDAHEALAKRFCEGLRAQGWDFEENAPYSGYDGLIDGVARHGRAHDCPYVELEVRQDLASHPLTRAGIVQAIANTACALAPSSGR